MMRSEKLEIAQMMRRHGMTIREIAADFGVEPKTVYAWFEDPDRSKAKAWRRRYSRPCPDCGRPMDGSGGLASAPKRCHRCTRIASVIWTREALCEAIRLFADRYGRPPGARDWNPALARAGFRDDVAERFYDDGCWPNTQSVVDRFGTWNAGIKAAGFTPLKVGHKYSDGQYA